MTDPYPCLRRVSIAIAAWSILYCLIQFGVLGWQTGYVRARQWEWENRKMPPDGGITYFEARHPGLYTIYSETPERRRINALFAIVLVALVVCIIHLVTSVGLLVGAVKRIPWLLFIWLFTVVATIVTTATYGIVWWAGDVFNEQLTMSIAEFGLAIVNCPCFVIVFLYYLRVTGKLTSSKPHTPDPMLAHRYDPKVPEWRQSIRERPSEHFLKKLKRQERRRISAAWDAYEKAQRERGSTPHAQNMHSPDYRQPSPYIPTPDYGYNSHQQHVPRAEYRPGHHTQRRYSSSPDKSGLRRSRSKSPTARRVYSKKHQEQYTNV
ncbi:hypothetical protein QR680_007985 [Steinernema hermaphroditum]|uniref:Uncharacterized protein n=1 Tax=Steinernema hermaphroditum TaxID=289476 RepID=A0AA39IEW3_9BILA|nr:hypothetical protein QR680_007985 [Steinernema hermaphroditum]